MKIPLNDAFVQTVSLAIHDTWAQIAPDAEAIADGDNYAALELCLDAGRLVDCTNDKAEGEKAERVLQRAYTDHGFRTVVQFLMKYIKLV